MVVNRIAPQRWARAGHRPRRPPVTRHRARCTFQKPKMNHRGCSRGVRSLPPGIRSPAPPDMTSATATGMTGSNLFLMVHFLLNTGALHGGCGVGTSPVIYHFRIRRDLVPRDESPCTGTFSAEAERIGEITPTRACGGRTPR